MVKIFNIHSNTLSDKELDDVAKALSSGSSIVLYNQDIRYEIIDTESGKIVKSKNYTKNIYALYSKIKIFVKMFIVLIKKVKNTKKIKDIKR